MKAEDRKKKQEEIQKVTLEITGMTCPGCASRVEEALEKSPGVVEVQVNFSEGKAYIHYNGRETAPSDLIRSVVDAGYEAQDMD